jgi:hypothetical protein
MGHFEIDRSSFWNDFTKHFRDLNSGAFMGVEAFRFQGPFDRYFGAFMGHNLATGLAFGNAGLF